MRFLSFTRTEHTLEKYQRGSFRAFKKDHGTRGCYPTDLILLWLGKITRDGDSLVTRLPWQVAKTAQHEGAPLNFCAECPPGLAPSCEVFAPVSYLKELADLFAWPVGEGWQVEDRLSDLLVSEEADRVRDERIAAYKANYYRKRKALGLA